MDRRNRSPQPKEVIQPRLQSLLDTSSDHWTYAIFWQPSYFSSTAVLNWCDGYYLGPIDQAEEKLRAAQHSAALREHRKRVLRQLNNGDKNLADDDVTDTEWFFLVSMSESFSNGAGLPGQVLGESSPVWVAGCEQFEGSGCDRERRGKSYGIETMAFIPSGNGVVELGSTEFIRQNSDLIHKVESLFDDGKGDDDPPER